MITINCGFSRTVRKPHKRKRVENKNVTGIKLDMDWKNDDHVEIRKALMQHKPPGNGWGVSGYAQTRETGI